MDTEGSNLRIWMFVLLTGLSVSIGWGIRGQFGHEYGAALPGALGGMVVALLSGREDWRRRVHFFAVLGAIGFAFGGSMSYMKDIWYAHSSDPSTVLYGFACIFLLGFIWAAPAGAGIALAAYLDREQLTKFYVPLCSVFIAWYLQSICCDLIWNGEGGRRARFFAGYEMSAILAAVVALGFFLLWKTYRGVGTLLILYMSIGWWAGKFIFIELLHLRMNPPREETWASCLGMVFGILACCWQRRLGGIAFATLGVGFLGGIGFALGTAVKLLVMSSGLTTNWHSIMEQTQGLFLGVAIAIIFEALIRRAPQFSDDPPVRRWTEVFSVVFVLWLLPYLNFRLSPGEWVGEIKGLHSKLYGINIVSNLLPSQGFVGWLDFVALVLGFALVLLLVLHRRRPLPCIPVSWMGKGQLFYLVFLWLIVAMNFMLVLPRFTQIRLVTEWCITLNATACSVLLIYGCFARPSQVLQYVPDGSYASSIRKVVIFGLLGAVAVSLLGFGIKLACWGNQPAGVLGVDPIRFGPNNTNTIR
ncbi:MAG TPA: hypothetical protein VND66_14000 [Acidobacteriaceae bacterium]|nr:hypothetical protein [Acidobacteriaceae bacterium]